MIEISVDVQLFGLPQEFRNADTLKSFKTKVKTYLFSQAFF
jgi:hypothetical protein